MKQKTQTCTICKKIVPDDYEFVCHGCIDKWRNLFIKKRTVLKIVDRWANNIKRYALKTKADKEMFDEDIKVLKERMLKN